MIGWLCFVVLIVGKFLCKGFCKLFFIIKLYICVFGLNW